jgi:hypothetical protein
MTPPTWLDAASRHRPTLACWTCGRETAPMRLRASDLQRMEWTLPETRLIPDWSAARRSTSRFWPATAGGTLVPIWEPEQTPNPLRRWEPAVPYWARDP